MKVYMRERRASRRLEILRILGNSCAVCGSTEYLEINHLNTDEKEFTLSGCALDKSWDRILAEVSKCNLLCLKHHKVFTRSQWESGQLSSWNKNKVQKTREEFYHPHGSCKRYNQGCRCGHCRYAKVLYRSGVAKFSEIVDMP